MKLDHDVNCTPSPEEFQEMIQRLAEKLHKFFEDGGCSAPESMLTMDLLYIQYFTAYVASGDFTCEKAFEMLDKRNEDYKRTILEYLNSLEKDKDGIP